MPVVQIDPGFYYQLLFLAGHSAKAAAGTRLVGQRSWFYPPLDNWSGDPLDLRGMQDAFDRDDLNAAYVFALNNPEQATVADAAAAKLQIGFVEEKERAFRTRHASRIRCAAHTAARNTGHGDANGVILGSMLSHVQNVIESGGGQS